MDLGKSSHKSGRTVDARERTANPREARLLPKTKTAKGGTPWYRLKVEFPCNLKNTRGVRGGDDAKVTGVDTAVGILKLCMVEDVERFESQIECLRFGEGDAFGKSHVPIVQARAMEEAAIGIADLAGLFEVKERDCSRGTGQIVCLKFGKDAAIEIGQSASGIGAAEGATCKKLAGSSQLWNIGSDGAGKRHVVPFRKLHGQAGGKGGDAGELPPTCDALRPSAVSVKKPVKRQVRAKAGNEIVLDVEEAESSAHLGIKGIGGIFEARRIVQTFSVGVAEKEFTLFGRVA